MVLHLIQFCKCYNFWTNINTHWLVFLLYPCYSSSYDFLVIRTLSRILKASSDQWLCPVSSRLQRFTADFRDLTSWVTEMKALINADELANDVAGAEALLDRHQEHKVPPPKSISASSHIHHDVFFFTETVLLQIADKMVNFFFFK